MNFNNLASHTLSIGIIHSDEVAFAGENHKFPFSQARPYFIIWSL